MYSRCSNRTDNSVPALSSILLLDSSSQNYFFRKWWISRGPILYLLHQSININYAPNNKIAIGNQFPRSNS